MEIDECPATHVSCLPAEILTHIFSYLDVNSKGKSARVCVAWREASFNKSLWRGLEAKVHLWLPEKINPLEKLRLLESIVERGIRRIQVLSLRSDIFGSVLSMENLETLNLSGCYYLTDEWLGHAVQEIKTREVLKLKVLNLSMCRLITDIGLSIITPRFVHLEVLDLSGCCNIDNSGLMHISFYLPRLKSLNIRRSSVTDFGIGFLAGAHYTNGTKELEHIDLEDCQDITDEALKHLSHYLHMLKSINLSFCFGITDIGLKYIGQIKTLEELNVKHCGRITDIGLCYLANEFSPIEVLDVSFCDVGDHGLEHISQGLYNLRSLSLNACLITDDGLLMIAMRLTDLVVLNIGQCTEITDIGLSLIADRLRNLFSIDVYGCPNITTVSLEKLVQLPYLSLLNLDLW